MSNRRFLCASPAYLKRARHAANAGRPGAAPLHRAPAERRRLRHLAPEPWPRHPHGQGARHGVQQRRRRGAGLGAGRPRHPAALRMGPGHVPRQRPPARGAGRLRAGAGRPVRLLPEPPPAARQSARFYQFSHPAVAAGLGQYGEIGLHYNIAIWQYYEGVGFASHTRISRRAVFRLRRLRHAGRSPGRPVPAAGTADDRRRRAGHLLCRQ